MFGTANRGVSAYANVGIETGVVAASPHRLIVMLYDGALAAILQAQQFMKAGNIAEKGRAISKAIQIIESGLRSSLNQEAGGEIAVSLDALYEYMSGRLFEANLKNQPVLLDEVYRLLTDLKGAWEAIDPAPVAVPGAPIQPVQDMLAPRSANFIKV